MIGYWFPKTTIDQSQLTSSTRAIAEGLEPRKVIRRHILLCLDFHRNKAANQVCSYLRYFLFHGGVPSFFPEVEKKKKKKQLRTVPTKNKGFCARLGPRGKCRSLQGLLESTKKKWDSLEFFRDNWPWISTKLLTSAFFWKKKERIS